MRRAAGIVGGLGILALAGCQTSGPSPIDGQWASADGVSVTTFRNGAFSTRVLATDEVVAEGQYIAAADGLQLSWTSFVTNEQRTAVCRFASRTQLACEPAGGQSFTMTRVA